MEKNRMHRFTVMERHGSSANVRDGKRGSKSGSQFANKE
jgi:hypothetical protein